MGLLVEALDPWGNLVLAGDTQGNFLVPLVGTRDLWVIKLDQQSVRQWGVQFDVSSYLKPKSVSDLDPKSGHIHDIS